MILKNYNVLGLTYVTKEGVKLDEAWGDIFQVLPENDPIKKIEWKYASIRFIVELPE